MALMGCAVCLHSLVATQSVASLYAERQPFLFFYISSMARLQASQRL